MVEFDETFSNRVVGSEALRLRALYRLIPKESRIPYFLGGRRFSSFSQTPQEDLTSECRRLLNDFDTEVGLSGDQLLVGDITINLSEEVV